MKTIKIDSCEKANKSALMQALLSVVFCILYAHIIMILRGGEEFVGKQPTKAVVNGIRLNDVLVVCGVIASVIPILFLRYSEIKFLCWYIPLSIAYYLIVMFSCMYIFNFYNIFDLILYATQPVPIGSFVGTVIAILFNQYKNNVD